MQKFKGDDLENSFYASGSMAIQTHVDEKNEFFENAFDNFILGDVLWQSERAPLASAMKQSIFREAFVSIFEAFIVGGSFESYLTVFRNIFGEGVEVTFSVPGPGRLNIVIASDGVELSDFAARYIENNEYAYDTLIAYTPYIEAQPEVPADPGDPENNIPPTEYQPAIEGQEESTDEIVLQGVKGFESQYELEQMLFEMVPAGIHTQITLTIGGV